MAVKTTRDIVRIDEEKCNGCGNCVIKCAEGALQIIDGKARLISDNYCDGLGACLGECPEDAITIEQRETDAFDEEAVEQHLHRVADEEEDCGCGCHSDTGESHEADRLACGCPSSSVSQFDRQTPCSPPTTIEAAPSQSMLGHWPVQLTLVPPSAPFLNGADVMLVADCVPFAYAGLHRDFLKDNAVLVACPKLDDAAAHQDKLTEVIRRSGLKSLTVVHMEMPCCSGLVHIARQAVKASGRDIPFREVTIGIRGDILD
ncbi:ATP-binding protein [Chloroflexota bacterium]